MKNKTLLLFILLLTFSSCNNNGNNNTLKPDKPKALQDASSSFDLISKRGYVDMVESIYSELASKDLELKTLEDKIDELNQSESDSLEMFNKFKMKNQSYYNSAKSHVSEIKDSLLKERIGKLLANQIEIYEARISQHNELVKLIESKKMKISDLYNVLKIVKTMPIIEKYQAENLPTKNSLKGYIKKQEDAIKLADTLIKEK